MSVIYCSYELHGSSAPEELVAHVQRIAAAMVSQGNMHLHNYDTDLFEGTMYYKY